VNPVLDFDREGAKHAKKTRRTLFWLGVCRPVYSVSPWWIKCLKSSWAAFHNPSSVYT